MSLVPPRRALFLLFQTAADVLVISFASFCGYIFLSAVAIILFAVAIILSAVAIFLSAVAIFLFVVELF